MMIKMPSNHTTSSEEDLDAFRFFFIRGLGQMSGRNPMLQMRPPLKKLAVKKFSLKLFEKQEIDHKNR